MRTSRFCCDAYWEEWRSGSEEMPQAAILGPAFEAFSNCPPSRRVTKDEQQSFIRQSRHCTCFARLKRRGPYVDIYNVIKTKKGNDPGRVTCSLHAGGYTQNVHKRASICIDGDTV